MLFSLFTVSIPPIIVTVIYLKYFRKSFSSDQNFNLTEAYPLASPYKPYIDPRRLHGPPVTPTTPTQSSNEASFFPPSFVYGAGNCLRPGFKRNTSSSSGVAEDSSTSANDENASSEGSVDSSGSRRRVSFRLDEEKPPEKREKIGNRRLSAPAFCNQAVASSTYDSTPYKSMFHPGSPNWIYPSPFSNHLLGYQELLHRMDTRSYLSPGYLSPLYPPYSPGGMYPPYSPFLKRASSFPNIAPGGDPAHPNGENLLSPLVPPYSPFAYFVGHSTRSRRSSEAVSPVKEISEEKVAEKQSEEEGNGRENVEGMEADGGSNRGKFYGKWAMFHAGTFAYL